ncbi:MAG: hypothetical protein K0S38_907 [Candidatus Paceibacter sp.]|jgi:hypothetical protein|nr:hypothetical protein [Candidatus Paceibacter sp.]
MIQPTGMQEIPSLKRAAKTNACKKSLGFKKNDTTKLQRGDVSLNIRPSSTIHTLSTYLFHLHKFSTAIGGI